MAQDRSGHPTYTWMIVGSLIFGVLRLNAILLVTLAPILVVCFAVVEPLRSFPTFLAAIVASSPGVAAAFTAFRDAPDLSVDKLQRLDQSEAALADGVIAQPYWTDDDNNALIKPYLRAYRVVAIRALVASALIYGVIVVLAIDITWVFGQPWGVFVIPTLAVFIAWLVAAWPVALVLVTEMPKAKFWPIIRSAIFLSLRRWYLTIPNLIGLAIFITGLLAQTLLMAVFGTSLFLFFIWANSRWIALPIIEAVEAEY